MKLIISIILSFFTLILVATCSSCRSVQKSGSSMDSLAISKMEMTKDSASEEELKRLIERLREDFVFTIRETTIETDSSGNVKEHVREKIMQHSTESSTDSLSQKKESSAHEAKTDSAATTKKEVAEEVIKEPNNHRAIVAGIIIIVIVLLIYNNRVKFRGF